MCVLIVEDEAILAMELEAVLAALGFAEVHSFGRLNQALGFLRARRPRFAILDIDLNGSPVYPLAAKLRARGVPIIFSTSFARSELPQPWADRPMVQKPLRKQDLAAAIASLGVPSRSKARVKSRRRVQ